MRLAPFSVSVHGMLACLQDCATISESQPWFTSPVDAASSTEHTVRAAAIHLQVTIYVFDIDAEPACCKIFFPYRPPIKAGMPKGKSLRIDTPCWSRILGQDSLPQQLSATSSQASQAFAVIAKADGLYHAYSAPQSISTHAVSSPAATVFSSAGLEFCEISFAQMHTRQRATGETATAGRKRKGRKRKRSRRSAQLDSDVDISDTDSDDADARSPPAAASSQVCFLGLTRHSHLCGSNIVGFILLLASLQLTMCVQCKANASILLSAI